MPDANKINKEMMNHALTRNGEFVCTDLILDQFEINEPTSEHSAYYNMLENNIQNESIISHLHLMNYILIQRNALTFILS